MSTQRTEDQPEGDPPIEEHLVIDPGEDVNDDDEPSLKNGYTEIEVDYDDLQSNELEENFIEDAEQEEEI